MSQSEKGLIKVLLIEDEEADATLVKNFLSKNGKNHYDIAWVPTILKSVEELSRQHFSVILLDLCLPDNQGLDSFLQVHDIARDIPIVILSGHRDEEIVNKAVRSGAQDYLIKGHFEADLLIRSIQYSIERNNLLQEIRKQAEIERSDNARSYHHYVSMSESKRPSASREKLLKDFYSSYRDLVRQYIRSIRIEEDRPANEVRNLADRLIEIKPHALDVIQLHLKVINEFSQRALPAEERAFSNDARLVLVELMGNLMDKYLDYSLKGG